MIHLQQDQFDGFLTQKVDCVSTDFLLTPVLNIAHTLMVLRITDMTCEPV